MASWMQDTLDAKIVRVPLNLICCGVTWESDAASQIGNLELHLEQCLCFRFGFAMGVPVIISLVGLEELSFDLSSLRLT